MSIFHKASLRAFRNYQEEVNAKIRHRIMGYLHNPIYLENVGMWIDAFDINEFPRDRFSVALNDLYSHCFEVMEKRK